MKKTWVKKKSTVLVCGTCQECGRELLSNQGGWIVTHKKQYFCHDGKDGSCFDNYCELKYKQQQQEKQYANGRKKEVQLYESWKEKSKSIRKEKRYEDEIKR
jgi:hypothetical protein